MIGPLSGVLNAQRATCYGERKINAQEREEQHNAFTLGVESQTFGRAETRIRLGHESIKTTERHDSRWVKGAARPAR